MYGLFNDSFQPAVDGVGTVVYNNAIQMYKMGRDVHVVVPYSKGEPEMPEPFPITRIPSVPVPPRPPYSVGLPFIPTHASREVYHLPFDLIHCHAPFTTGRMGRVIARRRDIPFITSFRSKYKDDFYGATKSRFISDVAKDWIMEFYRHADQVWITDESILETMHEYGFREKRGQIVVVPNGVETVSEDWSVLRERKRRELGLDDETPLFLFVGQQIRIKNVGMILDSLALLGDRKFLFYSLGSGVARGKFIDKAKSLGLQDRAIFPGTIKDRTELFSYYAAADLFLFPSLYDTYGNVIREAALMHTPSLLLEGTTCAAPFQDGVNAFIAKQNDPRVYADKIIETIRDVEGRQRVADRIPHTISRTWEDVVGEVVDRYDQLIAHHEKRGRFRL